MYAGCVASAIQKNDYLQIIKNAGFKSITLQKEKPIIIPDDILKNYLNEEEIKIYNSNKNIIFSITVYAEKQESCCDTNCC
jgi:arsenite methyltransferase